MKNSKEFAALWRQKLKQELPTVERSFGAFEGVFRRLPIAGWFKAGKVPQFLAHAMLAARETGNVDAVKKENLSPEEFDQSIKFQRDVVCQVCVVPNVVSQSTLEREGRELAEDEILYEELAERSPDVIDLIVAWTLAGSPDVPIKMADGSEATVADAVNFRGSGEDGEPSFASSPDGGFKWQTTPTSRDL